jgi:hypothetical protein
MLFLTWVWPGAALPGCAPHRPGRRTPCRQTGFRSPCSRHIGTFRRSCWPRWRSTWQWMQCIKMLFDCVLTQSTCIYRVQSSVWRLPNYWTPPLSTQWVCPSTASKAEGEHTSRAVRGWGVNISEDARHCIGLLPYTPSTVLDHLRKILFLPLFRQLARALVRQQRTECGSSFLFGLCFRFLKKTLC